MRRFLLLILAVVLVCMCGAVSAADGIVFENVTDSSGLDKYFDTYNMGHGGCFGDVNGDGFPDLYVGSFVDKAVKPQIPNMLFLSDGKGNFTLSDDKSVRLDGMIASTTCCVFADLDNDGDLDLVVSNLRAGNDMTKKLKAPAKPGGAAAGKPAAAPAPVREATLAPEITVFLENLGGGKFKDVTPKDFHGPRSGRNIGVYDFNNDGKLDLLLLDGSYGKAEGGWRVYLMENQGNWKFADVTEKYGLPTSDADGTGLGIGDLNNDGIFDFLLMNCNRCFISTKGGKYKELLPSPFVKIGGKGEGMPCGASFGDLNGDGLLDVVTSEHAQPSRIHVYLNKGIDAGGMPKFEEVSDQVGMGMTVPGKGVTGLAVKGAQIQLLDMDNDGLADIATAMIYQDEKGNPQPVVFRNTGVKGGLPQFASPPMDKLIGYTAACPMGDYDRDGKMDICIVSWGSFLKPSLAEGKVDLPSYLFRNVTPGGHWLEVKVAGKGERNPMGIGAVVWVYKAGQAGDAKGLIQRKDITVGSGYSSGEEAIAHLGLGQAASVDLVITWGSDKMVLKAVPVDKLMTVDFAPGGM